MHMSTRSGNAETIDWALVGDIGGTNSRFALARDGLLVAESIRSYSTATYGSLAPAVIDYLREQGVKARQGCVAIAGPVAGDEVRLTNSPWQFSIEQTCRELGWSRLQVLNDFEAVGLALPYLQPGQLAPIGPGIALEGHPRVALGPGTGYGATHVISVADRCIALPTEGGHVSIAPANAVELQLCQWLLDQNLQITCENLLSGPGLQHIYRALCAAHGADDRRLTAAEIHRGAIETGDGRCVQTLNVFCDLLGTAARDQALSTLARGGVYIAGGIVRRFIGFLRNSGFRQRFESSQTMHAVLKPIPVYVIKEEYPGLVGAAAQCRLTPTA